jgi:hypothetical protein
VTLERMVQGKDSPWEEDTSVEVTYVPVVRDPIPDCGARKKLPC